MRLFQRGKYAIDVSAYACDHGENYMCVLCRQNAGNSEFDIAEPGALIHACLEESSQISIEMF